MAASKGKRGLHFELRHLRYFIALVEEKNFERAAARLGIAQPGLSQQIMSLEAIVGRPVIDRSRRLVQLTPTGLLLYEEALKIVAQADKAIAALKRVERGETGRISIGYVASAAYSGLLTKSLGSFRRRHPDVELQLVEMEMGQQLRKISEGDLDFGYIRPPASIPPGLIAMEVLKERLVVAVPEGHPHAARTAVDLADLAGSTFITPRQPPDVGFHANTLMACGEAGFQPRISATGRDFTTIASMVAVGLGVSLVPESLQCVKLPGIRYVSLSGCSVTSDLAIAHRRSESSSVVRAFVAHHRDPDRNI